MNISVGSPSGKYAVLDFLNLGDNRVAAALDVPPVFLTMRLDRKLLRPGARFHGGDETVEYRRALPPEAFLTNWAYVDHLVLPPRASLGRHKHEGVEEVFYVMSGSGQVRIRPRLENFSGAERRSDTLSRREVDSTALPEESAAVKEGDAVAVLLNDVHSFAAGASGPLELMVIGIAHQKGVLDSIDVQ
jgi:mannose-6-phosphate isomerase-like protein (cupin superfamily)